MSIKKLSTLTKLTMGIGGVAAVVTPLAIATSCSNGGTASPSYNASLTSSAVITAGTAGTITFNVIANNGGSAPDASAFALSPAIAGSSFAGSNGSYTLSVPATAAVNTYQITYSGVNLTSFSVVNGSFSATITSSAVITAGTAGTITFTTSGISPDASAFALSPAIANSSFAGSNGSYTLSIPANATTGNYTIKYSNTNLTGFSIAPSPEAPATISTPTFNPTTFMLQVSASQSTNSATTSSSGTLTIITSNVCSVTLTSCPTWLSSGTSSFSNGSYTQTFSISADTNLSGVNNGIYNLTFNYTYLSGTSTITTSATVQFSLVITWVAESGKVVQPGNFGLASVSGTTSLQIGATDSFTLVYEAENDLDVSNMSYEVFNSSSVLAPSVFNITKVSSSAGSITWKVTLGTSPVEGTYEIDFTASSITKKYTCNIRSAAQTPSLVVSLTEAAHLSVPTNVDSSQLNTFTIRSYNSNFSNATSAASDFFAALSSATNGGVSHTTDSWYSTGTQENPCDSTVLTVKFYLLSTITEGEKIVNFNLPVWNTITSANSHAGASYSLTIIKQNTPYASPTIGINSLQFGTDGTATVNVTTSQITTSQITNASINVEGTEVVVSSYTVSGTSATIIFALRSGATYTGNNGTAKVIYTAGQATVNIYLTILPPVPQKSISAAITANTLQLGVPSGSATITFNSYNGVNLGSNVAVNSKINLNPQIYWVDADSSVSHVTSNYVHVDSFTITAINATTSDYTATATITIDQAGAEEINNHLNNYYIDLSADNGNYTTTCNIGIKAAALAKQMSASKTYNTLQQVSGGSSAEGGYATVKLTGFNGADVQPYTVNVDSTNITYQADLTPLSPQPFEFVKQQSTTGLTDVIRISIKSAYKNTISTGTYHFIIEDSAGSIENKVQIDLDVLPVGQLPTITLSARGSIDLGRQVATSANPTEITDANGSVHISCSYFNVDGNYIDGLVIYPGDITDAQRANVAPVPEGSFVVGGNPDDGYEITISPETSHNSAQPGTYTVFPVIAGGAAVLGQPTTFTVTNNVAGSVQIVLSNKTVNQDQSSSDYGKTIIGAPIGVYNLTEYYDTTFGWQSLTPDESGNVDVTKFLNTWIANSNYAITSLKLNLPTAKSITTNGNNSSLEFITSLDVQDCYDLEVLGINSCKKLQTLDLCHNHNLKQLHMEHIDNLTWLNLDNSLLEEMTIEDVKGTGMTDINLQSTNLVDFSLIDTSLNSLQLPSSLKRLSIIGSSNSVTCPFELNQCNSLESLYLANYNNPTTTTLSGISTLKELTVYNTNYEYISLESCTGLVSGNTVNVNIAYNSSLKILKLNRHSTGSYTYNLTKYYQGDEFASGLTICYTSGDTFSHKPVCSEEIYK